MLTDDEAVAVALGVQAAGRLGLSGSEEAVDGALAKIHRVLPDGLRRRVEALEATLDFTARVTRKAPVTGNTVLVLADAIRRRHRIRTPYRAFSGDETRRELSPHGLVVHSGRWYLAAYDHLRDDLRTFRVDRMLRVRVTNDAADDPPDGFDAVTYVSTSLARVPWGWEVEVVLELPVDEALRRVPSTMAEVADQDGATVLRMRADSLDWAATVLARLGCAFSIRRPDELRDSVRALGERLASSA